MSITIGDSKAARFHRLRKAMGLSLHEMARLLYGDSNPTRLRALREYEEGTKDVPPPILRLAELTHRHLAVHGTFPLWSTNHVLLVP